jgi:hypothetical protein
MSGMRPAARLAIPAAVFALLIGAAAGDGFFRDEFYYLACTHRLAWGYVDHPPLCVFVLWIVRLLFGDSLMVLRIAAAVGASAVVWLTGSIARRLGAGAFGELLAMTAAAVAPAFLAVGTFYSMNVLDVLLWTLAARVLIDVLDAPTDRRWLVLGLVLGLGLLNKISVLWLGAGLAAGLVLTPARRLVLTRGPWLAAAVAGLLFLPHVLWQTAHGWPTLEFIRTASATKMQTNTPGAFLRDQVMNMNPLTLPLWLGGVEAFLLARRFRPYRTLGVAFLVVTLILILNRTSRSGYLLPAYPMLFAAGGALWESRVRRPAVRWAAIAVLAISGALLAPLAVPILDTDAYVRYSAALGVAPGTEERHDLGRLPQFFADRQGWPVFVDDVVSAWNRLTPDEQRDGAVFAGNYGEAGAIERLAPGIPVLSGHNTYWFWGPGGVTGRALVVLTRDDERLRTLFAEVEQVGSTSCGDCMPYERGLGIFVCRGLRAPLSRLWPEVKHFD